MALFERWGKGKGNHGCKKAKGVENFKHRVTPFNLLNDNIL